MFLFNSLLHACFLWAVASGIISFLEKRPSTNHSSFFPSHVSEPVPICRVENHVLYTQALTWIISYMDVTIPSWRGHRESGRLVTCKGKSSLLIRSSNQTTHVRVRWSQIQVVVIVCLRRFIKARASCKIHVLFQESQLPRIGISHDLIHDVHKFDNMATMPLVIWSSPLFFRLTIFS